MTKYVYKSRDSQSKLVEGVMQANSSKEVVNELLNKGLIAVSVEEVKEKKLSKAKKVKITLKRQKVSTKDISIFCRQMATMINAGVSVIEAVEDISQMSLNIKFKEILKNVVNDIKMGNSLSEALNKHPGVFNKVFTSMIRAGEESGNLDVVLSDLAGYLEDEVKLKRKLQSASMYPMFIAGFMGFVVAGLVLFLVPQFKKLFLSLGADLPLPTKIIMGISELAVKNIFLLILLAIGAVLLFGTYYRTKKGRFKIDKAILKIPVFGILITKAMLARFFLTLSTLLRSGVDIVASLEIASKVMNNMSVEDAVDTIRIKIMEGSNLSAEMNNYQFFPRMTVRMTSIGEKSGKIDEVLVKVAQYYTDEVDATVEGFSSIIEPVLIIVLGGVIGIFVICMYLPIFKMAMAMMGSG